MKPLSQGEFAFRSNKRYTIVDDDDYEELSKFKWNAYTRRNNVYSARRSTPRVNGRRGTVIMSRAIVKASPKHVVYHKNGEGLDNRKENLLVCLRSKFAQQSLSVTLTATQRRTQKLFKN